MTPAMATALASGRATITCFFELGLPSGTRRLLLGSTEVPWGGNTYKGYDDSIGSIDGPDELREDAGSEAPNTSLSIKISPNADRDDIAGQDAQLAPFKAWLAALTLDGSNHVAVIADPEMLFDGYIDQATINLDKGRDELDYTVISAFDYFFEDSEGQRLNDQFLRSIWPAASNEGGFKNITGVTKKIYWGTYGPGGAGSATSGGGGIIGSSIGANGTGSTPNASF